jgi:transporter family protein
MTASSFPVWLLYAALALVFWGISGITQKLSTNRISSELSFLWFVGAMITISSILYIVLRTSWHLPVTVFCLAAIGGALNGGGVLTSFLALESGGKASIVISLISLFPLPTVAFAVLALHERLTRQQSVGVMLAIVAAILLSQEPAPNPTPSPAEDI